MLTILERVLFLLRVPLLKAVPTETLAHLASIASELELAEGQPLWQTGDPAAAVYFVLEGELAVIGEAGQRASAREGDDLGMIQLVRTAPHDTTATALRPSKLLKMTREDFSDALIEHPELARALLFGSLSSQLSV